MSRIGKQAIAIPLGVAVTIEGQRVLVKGPKGELSRVFRDEIAIEQKENILTTTPREQSNSAKALWGLSRTLLANMVEGVTKGYIKKLEIEGIGYRAAV